MAVDLGPALGLMLDAANLAVAADPPLGRVHLATGTPAWDDCCSGQLWLRVVSQVPAALGGRATAPNCGVPAWTVTFGLGLLRCAQTVRDDGSAPPPAALTAEALQVATDAATLCRVIECDWTKISGLERITPTVWTPLGPDGGCVGGEWQATVLVTNCGCP